MEKCVGKVYVMNDTDVIRYEDSHEKIWDKFINENSVNGTFLHTRAFLNYHPKERFKDCSLFICAPQNIYQPYAVVPACEYMEDNQKVFYSHMGSTFGGIIISSAHYTVLDISDFADCLDKWLANNAYYKVILKITPDIFSQEKTDLLQYLLWNKGYEQYTELSTYIDFSIYSDDLLSNFNRRKQRDVKKCSEHSLEGKFFEKPGEIEIFYTLLCENLLKHNTKPVHTIEEIFALKSRLENIVTFYGIYDGEQMVAGAMLFFFKNTNTYHIQYSCAKQGIKEYSPMPYLFYKLIEFSHVSNARFLSFGISTEQKGQVLNMGLIKAKEEYGVNFSLNRTFYKIVKG